jgi:hypothetical protein
MTALTDEQITKLENAGAKRWTKYGKDRLYIDADVIGLEVECYRSGSVRSAAWQGESISNSDASRIMMGRSYVDVATGDVVTKCTFNPRADVMGYDEAVQRFVDAALAK